MTHGHSHRSDCINLLCNGTLWERGIEWKIKMGRENQIFILSFSTPPPSIKSRRPVKAPTMATRLAERTRLYLFAGVCPLSIKQQAAAVASGGGVGGYLEFQGPNLVHLIFFSTPPSPQ